MATKKKSKVVKKLMAKKKFNDGDLVLGKTEEEIAEEKRISAIQGAKTTGFGMLGGTLESVSGMIGAKDVSGINPNDLLANMKKRDAKSLGVGIGAKAAMGAAAGSVIPGLGTVIGAGAGALLGGVEALFKAKKLKRERAELGNQLATDALAYNNNARNSIYGFKKGGLIEGKGTSTSDSIDMNSKNGSFIVPAKNKAVAMELGKAYLGWKDNEKTVKSKSGKGIKVSDGEVEFTPNETLVLTAMGIDLPKLAPDSVFAQNVSKMEDGGFVALKKRITDHVSNDEGIQDMLIRNNITDHLDSDIANVGNPDFLDLKMKKAKKPFMKGVLDYRSEIFGGGQLLAGGISLAKNAGKEPKLSVSQRLLDAETSANDDSKYGLSPEIRNKAERDIALKGRTLMDRIFENVGGSAQSKYNQSAAISNQINNDILSLAAMDEQEKSRKKELKRMISGTIAGREHEIQSSNLQRYDQNQAAFAELLNAGIDNIVGSQKYKKQLELQRNRKEISNNVIN